MEVHRTRVGYRPQLAGTTVPTMGRPARQNIQGVLTLGEERFTGERCYERLHRRSACLASRLQRLRRSSPSSHLPVGQQYGQPQEGVGAQGIGEWTAALSKNRSLIEYSLIRANQHAKKVQKTGRISAQL